MSLGCACAFPFVWRAAATVCCVRCRRAQVLLEGDLYGRVKSFEHGSFWELVKEGNKLVSWAERRARM